MRQNQRKDSLANKETLNFLITITEMLKSSNAILGRNNVMFALDASKAPLLLKNDNVDLGEIFIERKLVVDHDDLYGAMSIITGYFTVNNIIFCDIAGSLSPLNHNKDEDFPFHEDVRNWYLSIPELSGKDKNKYEATYQKRKDEFNELMHENASELYKAIFSLSKDSEDQDDKKKLH